MTSPWLQGGGGGVVGGQAGAAYPFTPGGGWGPAQDTGGHTTQNTEHRTQNTEHRHYTSTSPGQGAAVVVAGGGHKGGW